MFCVPDVGDGERRAAFLRIRSAVSTGTKDVARGGEVAQLELRGLTVRFGALTAVDGVDMSVDEGSFVGLIGPNGAGKTTLIDAVSGIVPAEGAITFCGERVDHLGPHRRARRGLARTFQSVELFDELTIRENLLTAAEPSTIAATLASLVRSRSKAEAMTVVDETLELLGISEFAERRPGELSLGERKLATVARGMAGKPRLLLLDEPAAGLDTDESLALGVTLRDVANTGVSILLVDHDMGLVLNVCDSIYVLEFGAVISSGTAQEVANDPRVITAYLGEEGDKLIAHGETLIDEVVAQ
jgi:ABC-type branched-subunit amino acid transport system ATPase component